MVIKPILWKHYKREDSTSQVKIRITKNRSTSYYPVEVYVRETEFTTSFGSWVKSSRVNAAILNAKIRSAYNKVEAHATKNSELTAKQVVEGIDKDTDSFYEHFQQKIDYAQAAFSYGTYKRLKSVLKKMKEFAPELAVKEMSVDWLRRYEKWLITKKDNATNTITANMKCIKAVVNDLVKQGLIEYPSNPFLYYKTKWERVKKERLSMDAIDKIIEVDLEKDSHLWHVRNAYLFSFYCAGIRFADMATLMWSNIDKSGKTKRLVYTMGKTNKHRSVKLLEQALDILKGYRKSDGYIFPILKSVLTKESELVNKIGSANSLYNHSLKVIARIAEVNDKISFHTARHSFADWAIKKNVDIRTLKDLLGHDKVSTTEIYAKDFYEEEADAAMDKLFTKHKK